MSPFKNMPDSYKGPIAGMLIGSGLFAFTLKYCSDMIQRINDFEDGTFNPKLIRDYSQEEFKQFKIMMTGEDPDAIDEEEDEDDDDDEEEEEQEAEEEEVAEEVVVEAPVEEEATPAVEEVVVEAPVEEEA